MLTSSAPQIAKILLLQLAVSLMVGAISWFFSQSVALSAISGGLIASLANAWFAWKVFSGSAKAESAKILSTCYQAEVGKVIMTVMLFIVAIVSIKSLNIIALMCAYLFITMIPWLASFFINNDKDYDSENWREKNVR
ncbi:hypothetical protein MNBD_GAMMA11-1761 [hydrothermal vent metagenome]|uniref:ATP synthase protein I n=1 Tax=hydrothermal vent metagenome TaxID=652676 RepID=A0A3B0XNJ5_9ZZZZ